MVVETGVNKLVRLQGKIEDINSKIDEADLRRTNAKNSSVESSSRLEKAEGEVASFQRRIRLVQQNLNDVNDRAQMLQSKVDNLEDVSESVKQARSQYEEEEAESDEKIQSLEEEVKLKKRELEENEIKLREKERRNVVVHRDIEAATVKADAIEKRIEILESTIKNGLDSIKDLEEREGRTNEKENNIAEQISFFANKFKEVEIRIEAAERNCNVLEHNIKETTDEIQTWKHNTHAIEEEIAAMDDVGDDDIQ